MSLPCEYKKKMYQVKFHDVDIPTPPVFCAYTCKEMGLVQRVFAVETSKANNMTKFLLVLDACLLNTLSKLY